jgi:hypothetical protein
MSVVYVSSVGQDSQEGTAKFPFKTLTRALQQARPGDVIQAAPGTYQAEEQFPLFIPPGVTLAGAGNQVVFIQGGGTQQQSGGRHVAVILGDRAQIREVSITNSQGIGIFTTEGAALIVNNRLVNCQQQGVWVGGRGQPFVSKNEFTGNGSTGLAIGEQAKGEIRQNQFEQTGEGIVVGDRAAPLIIGNQLTNHRCALTISGNAKPVLRQNQLIDNQDTALWIKDRAAPDLGHPQDLGSNQLEGKTYDLRNDTPTPLATAGNRLNPLRVRGELAYLPSEIPDDTAVPTVLLGAVEPTPLPPSRPAAQPDPLAGVSLNSRFNDLVGHWAAPFVEALADKNLVKGFLDETFQPDAQVTRAQFAALLTAAFPDLPTPLPVVRFPDVPSSFWAAQAIRQAQTRGFLSGFPDGAFRPNAPLTKVQAIVALVNGLALGKGRPEALWGYRDRARIPSYALEAVATATEQQVVVSYPDPAELRPLAPISRAETTALVHQALVATGKTPRLPSAYIPKVNLGSPNFTDLPTSHWAKKFIDPLVQKSWLNGFQDGTFKPDAPITRAQFAALLVGALEPQPKRAALTFHDVPSNFWAAEVIQKAYRAEYLSGFPDLSFAPHNPVTKLQALLAISSGLNLQAVSPPNLKSLQVYRDSADVPSYAASAIATATQLGLVFNRPNLNELQPNRTATRAEVSAMVYQALVLLRKMPPVTAPEQVLLP